MINREIPFRPRLEGEFRVRFYNAASEITEKTPTLTIARIAEREIEWVEKDCQYNIEQRKKYRAVWFLFRDLIRASWKACYRNGVIYMSLPTLNGTDMHDTTSPEVKALLRSWMSESRHERLVGYTDFINRMENPGTNKQSIAALIADGDELEKRIKRVHTGEIAIETAVQPYLQLVRENDRDVFTGLKTSEIWRYFRLTWSTPVETTPGRTMQYLIRDAAHPMHAVMGIASLENCAVQITCRDDYIGWNQKAFIERIVTVDNDRAKEEFKQLLVYLEDGIDGIDYSELCTAIVESATTRIEPIEVESQGKTGCKTTGVSSEEIEQLVKDFKRSCGDYHVALRECEAAFAVVGPSVIRLKFKLGRGQALQGLASHLEDIGREMKRTGVIIQQVPNSDELLLDVPRVQREKVLFKDVISSIPKVTSPEQLLFPLGRTPNGKDLIEDLSQMPHMLVGGSTGSGKSVFLFSMLAALLMTHPKKEDMQLILSSSKLEDFIHFEGLPHLYSGRIISDATKATKVIKEVIFEESERRGRLLAEARVANIVEYNKKVAEKLAPIVVVIDEFADLADQLETTKEKNAFYKPVQRIAQAGRSRGIHLVICTQRPEAKLVPSTTKAQLNGRVALRVNDGISSRMIIEEPDAQYLQKHGDMIYRNGDIIERAQGYLIEIEELDKIVDDVIHGRI